MTREHNCLDGARIPSITREWLQGELDVVMSWLSIRGRRCKRSASVGLSFLIRKKVIVCTQPQRRPVNETLCGATGCLTQHVRGGRRTGPAQPPGLPRELGTAGEQPRHPSRAGDRVLRS